jgi:predicted nucleotidyltransferase
MLTKTETIILKLLCSTLTKSYTIRGISRGIKKSFPITHQAAHKLIKKRLVLRDENKLISLNYLSNFQELSYIESLRAEDFLKRHREIRLFVEEVLDKIDSFFTLLVFGSYAVNKQTKTSDIDILMIVNGTEDTEKQERFLNRIAEVYLKKPHCYVINRENVRGMIKERNKLNVMNETLDKHIIFWGADDYYRLIS